MLDRDQPDRTDLADSLTWSTVETQLDQAFWDALLGSPPCGTFSGALDFPLRSGTPPGIYGLPNLSRDDLAKVRMGTLLAVRTATA